MSDILTVVVSDEVTSFRVGDKEAALQGMENQSLMFIDKGKKPLDTPSSDVVVDKD